MTTFENANPGFLKKIFSERSIAGEKEKIAIKAVLVLLDEPVKDVGIAAAESSGERLSIVRHESGE
jgi:hypothetical protein